MRILVLGAGGTGGYFGGRMAQAGLDVTFLVRPERAKVLDDKGLVILSPLGDATVQVKHVTADTVSETGAFDLVLLSCKAYDLHAAMEAIDPAVGDTTVILPILNGLAHYPVLDKRFGPDRVLGGLCVISAAKGPHGEIIHFGNGASVTFGERDGQLHDDRCAAIADVFAAAKLDHTHSSDIQRDLWAKFSFLTTLAATTCLFRASVGDIVATDDGRVLIERTYEECLAIARASGHAVPDNARAFAWKTLTQQDSPLTASMLRDLESGQRIESDHIIGDMLRRARDAGIAAPLLEVAFAHLQAFDVRRARESRAP
ncbi:2-dehydropantoate 2-reductase [Luteibacter sp. UNCMF366Tsu5.1]|uniref:2-dehydropantoate 2-reductase n=1 Tax=Luteibacter sp. UNCMF366Tsu5.1 TaxID=1502758 RepID=UPI0009085824|nr:2-dehydropantoate 2-reductase [Luteibacter sp. UNCMF366Tsu5.1]SFW32309.1 2-dehydropantoate 2-reductase [Luteibacter sp. UNCMF366Tsu5.1]